MAKKTYRKSSARRRKHERRSTLASIVAAIALILLVYALYGSTPRNHSAKTGNVAACTYEQLSQVILPAGLPQQIVDYPGFTVNFNAARHVPNYVVWELTADECNGSEKRLNNFFKDPGVVGCPEPRDYKKSGYTRGHMAPAADMKWSAEAIKASNYLTNVCPQSAAMNSGAWSKLEENCRSWARRDSAIIIISGPVLTDRMPLHIGRNHVAVPERFFKVVLAPYADPPRGIGFVMPNSRVPGGVQSHAVSIDRVEEITGYDFFSALPDDIEHDVESQCSYPRWQTLK